MSAQRNEQTAIPAYVRWITQNAQDDSRTWHPRRMMRRAHIPFFVLPSDHEEASQRRLAVSAQ